MSYFELSTPTDVMPDAVAAWQDGRTGEVVAVRQKSAMDFVVETYPENYHDDKQPMETVKRVKSHKDNALAVAREYMND